MAGIFDILPGYLKMPNPADVDLETYLKRITPDTAKPDPWDSFNYWSNTPKFAVSFLKAMYGAAATKGKRLGLPPPAEDRPQLFLGEYLERHVRRQGQRNIRLRHERRHDRPRFAEEYRRPEKGRLAGGVRDLSRRDQRILAGSRHHRRRRKEDQHHRVSPARRGFCRKRRHVRQLRALAAVEERGRAAARPGPPRSGNSGHDFPEGPRAVSEGRRQVPRSHPARVRSPTRTRTIRRSPKSPKKSTAKRSPTSPTPRPSRPSRPASNSPVLPG